MFISARKFDKAHLIVTGVAVALSFAAVLSEARAETRVFGCNFVQSYSAAQVNYALTYAKAAVGTEATSLYRQYMSLKSECRTNRDAKRSVSLSPEMVALISN